MPAAAVQPAIATQPAREFFHSSAQRKLVLGLLLVAATLALYNPVARNGFVNFDDDRYVTDNQQVRAGLRWRTISWAFTTLDQANWHPLTWLSHALDCQFFQLNPAGHHYTNLLLHATNVLLLFLILQWFTGYTGRSLMVAALFAVHPLNVESVAWAAERKNVLSLFFFLLAVAAYGCYVRKPTVVRYLLIAVLFAMGLMSKPMVITLPLVLLLLDYWPLRRFTTDGETEPAWKLTLEKVPLLALSAASAIITMMAQRAGGAVLTSATHAPLLRLENVIVCYAVYVRKMIWPSQLAVLYPYPHALPAWQVAACAIFLLSATVVVLRYSKHRYLVVGWFWYLGTMVPMIGLIQVGNQAMADRYAYLPMIGLFTMMVWAAADWASAFHLSPMYMTTAGLAALLALSAVTRIQLNYWHDDLALWQHALAVTQNNFVAENNFASALTRQGRYDEAIPHFRTAAALEPGDPASQLNLGIYAQQHGDPQQAAARYEEVLRLTTDTQLRASAYANLGTVYFALRDYDRAQLDFDSALKLKPAFPAALLDMGIIAQKSAQVAAEKTAQKNDWKLAANDFAQFVALAPSDVGYLLLANALQQAGEPEASNQAYRLAQQLSTDMARAQRQAAHVADQ